MKRKYLEVIRYFAVKKNIKCFIFLYLIEEFKIPANELKNDDDQSWLILWKTDQDMDCFDIQYAPN